MHAGFHVSDAAVTLVAEFEGFRPHLYNCAAGHCTIGYGHLVHRGETGTDAAAESAYAAGISRADATTLLLGDLQAATAVVAAHVTAPLTQPQIDALASFVFNLGDDAFTRSTLLKRINAGQMTRAGAEFARWTMAHDPHTGALHVLPGLVKRRAVERRLFEQGSV